jgi:hypothetical protein
MGVYRSLQGVRLYDAYGIPIPVAPDTAIPANTKALLAAGTDGTNARVLLTNQAGAIATFPYPAFHGLTTGYLEDSGNNENMNIDGSTPVEFKFDCDDTDDLYIACIRILLLPNVLRMDNGSFGSLSGPLTNGCEFSITTEGTKYVLGLLKQTEHVAELPGGEVHTELGLPANGALFVTVNLGGTVKLVGGSSDKVSMLIQDDLTAAGPNSIKRFTVKVSAHR